MTLPPEPLDLLYEAAELPNFDLPDELRDRYGGSLGFHEPCLFANFVSTVDGVVAIPAVPQSNRLIGAGLDSDRFVMALLRACADVVVIGSGTLHGSPRALWTAEHAYPSAAAAFSELRRRRGRPPEPELAVLTGTGSINPAHPALEAGAVVLTTDRGAARLRGRLPVASTAIALGSGAEVDPRAAADALRARGRGLILSEAGPRVFGALVAAGLVDELFLTLSPLLAGRSDREQRPGLVQGVDLLPLDRVEGRLLGARRDGAHLFLRYGIEQA